MWTSAAAAPRFDLANRIMEQAPRAAQTRSGAHRAAAAEDAKGPLAPALSPSKGERELAAVLRCTLRRAALTIWLGNPRWIGNGLAVCSGAPDENRLPVVPGSKLKPLRKTA